MAVLTFNLVLGRQRQENSEFKDILVYKASSRTARATPRNPVLKNQIKGLGI